VALVPGWYWAKRCSLGYASRSQASSLMILSLEIGFISGGHWFAHHFPLGPRGSTALGRHRSLGDALRSFFRLVRDLFFASPR